MTRTFRAATLLAATVGAAVSVGCVSTGPRPGVQARYNEYVDPCWPERYSQQAREAALNPHDIQVANAQVIDQTIWNYHFEAGTATLNANGRQRLDYLARRLPVPDARLYIQTARDVAYDAAAPEKTINKRNELDAKRSQAVLAYLAIQPNGARTNFEVQAIDAIDPGVNSAGPASSVRGLPAQYRSTLNGAVGGGLQGAGGNLQFGAATFVPTQQGPGQGNGPAPR
jgi:hypothetical protein